MSTREIYWHLPGFYSFKLLNQIIMNMMKDYPNSFREGYRIGSVYGTFPGAVWNGGRTILGIVGKTEIESVLKLYNSRGIPVRFTWTNSLLEKKHLQDTYCNLVMRLADNGMNQVLVNAPVLEEYLRKEYPDFKLISSTTKRLIGLQDVMRELEKDFFLVVLDYDLNHNEKVLKSVEPCADRIELLVNEICTPGCMRRKEHYEHQSLMQLEFDMSHPFHCPNRSHGKTFEECKKLPAFLSNEEICDYIDRGFVNFKIAGRGMPQEFLKESYLYFLVKEEQREFIREKVDGLLARFQAAMQGGGKLYQQGRGKL